ncbi:MAG: DNA polymerase III subunit epsilon [Legionella sp.]|uniref:DNA polymerase III subunit epsilon n=1 Tax=Legionella sp. TaxID=459 RepID=UPI0039E6EC4D
MRQIVLDTETTGIGHEQGHRIIEIGCVELVDRKLTGKHFHVYLNPERTVDEGAFRVHGISDEFLQDKPLFKDKVSEFLQFIGGTQLIIHNAAFDVGFLNAELRHVQWKKKLEDYCDVFDTLTYARDKFPGQRNSLDALCKRFGIDHFNRDFHGALLDAEILAFVYLAMTGGQGSLFAEASEVVNDQKVKTQEIAALHLANPIVIRAQDDEVVQHREFIEFLTKKTGVDFWE